jgi:integrase
MAKTTTASGKRYVLLHKKAIESLPPAAPGKRDNYYIKRKVQGEEEPVPYLMCLVTDTGSKTLMIQRRFNGRQRRVRICKAGEMSAEDVIRRAREINATFESGKDPEAAKRAVRDMSTLAGYWETYAQAHVANLSERTQVAYRHLWKTYLAPALGSRKLAEITRKDVVALHGQVRRKAGGQKQRVGNGARTANQAIALLRAMFNHALYSEAFTGSNPADRIKRFKEPKRERYLTLEEIGRLYEALEEDAQVRCDWTYHDLFKMLLLTGARRGNVQGMRWRDIDWDNQTWAIPGDATKTGTRYDVVLEAGAMEILARRREWADQAHREAVAKARSRGEKRPKPCPWVFPWRTRSGHVSEVKSRWRAICAKGEIVDATVHDLRHTHASLLAQCGISLQIIGRQLGHRSSATTARYSHLSTASVRQAVGDALGRLNDEVKPRRVEAEVVETSGEGGAS